MCCMVTFCHNAYISTLALYTVGFGACIYFLLFYLVEHGCLCTNTLHASSYYRLVATPKCHFQNFLNDTISRDE